jgi:hypothetical protein
LLDELVVEDDGKRYVGHVWSGLAQPLMASQPAMRWYFAHHGHVIAEFPATVLDTPAAVKARLLTMMARNQPSEAND